MRQPALQRHAILTKLKTIAPTKAGEAPIRFHPGGLHASTGTPQGQPIPPATHAAAEAGTLGPKAKAQEQFFRNVLKK